MTIGEKIKIRREELGWSQEELARKVGYKSRSSINKIELSHELPLKKIESIAKALDISPSYLMGWVKSEVEESESIGRIAVESIKDGRLQDAIYKYEGLSEEDKKMVIGVIDSIYKSRHSGS